MYAQRLSEAGWKVNACDRDDLYESLREEYADNERINIVPNGHFVSRASDYILYSVEAASIEKVVSTYGPSTKLGAIVGGQTSCKAPEIAAFEKYLPEDVEIVSCHSLHGPKVDPEGQPLVSRRRKALQKLRSYYHASDQFLFIFRLRSMII
ncbi:Prephenate dehydrogenase [Blumeria graminis f. sp. tritici 96224]|uniref:Bgt-735 n=1 Tax=Blumeria graminis f. sp. tritici 96224 TaxID=1268274 RepID=A0A381LAF5_BLUGR|nr:Prephenate dehydrogenase [Blumeria graminis f. sp. tritici 96224]